MKWAYGLFEVLDIPPAERSVLLAICWWHKEKSDECAPAQAELAKMTGYRRQRVNEAISSLEGYGLIKREKTKRCGQYTSCSYRLFGSMKRPAMSGRGDTAMSKKKDTAPMSGRGDTIRGNIKGDCDESFNVLEFPGQEMLKAGGRNV
ncbi:hypothetical protein XM52_13635 [Roseovarius indicus]|uniref:Helix-turn-helix domain-containing protein n=2 Tax=Roseovarius indicus TaxID=540747 RepID=A0A0T5P9C3_9RHOB|nr:hypothetical protein XM52_13635 [Roseovarius indicus]